MITFRYRETEVPVEITWKDALGKLDDLGVDVLSILDENNTVIQTIMLNNKVMVKVWYYYVHLETADDFETALEYLTSEDLERFKDKFWEAVVLFSPPLVRGQLQEIWREAKKQLRSQGRKSMNTSSDSLPEQE